jgi:hypothetical protein
MHQKTFGLKSDTGTKGIELTVYERELLDKPKTEATNTNDH